MNGQQPRRNTMKAKFVFQSGTKNGEDAMNIAIDELEKDGYQIAQIMNITSSNVLDDMWKLIIVGVKPQEDPIIEKPNMIVEAGGRKMN